MRKLVPIILTFLVITTACAVRSNAQSTLIYYWNFNAFTTTMYTPTIDVISPDYSDLPTAHPGILYAEQAGTSAAYSSFIESHTSSTTDYDTVNLRMSAPAGTYIRTHNPCDSMELLFYTPAKHFTNLKLTFGTLRPINGATHQNYDYSVDSGTTWISTGLSMTTDSVWSVFQRITLTTTNTAVVNNPRLVFRVTWTGNNTGTTGNNSFDNVTFEGDSITVTTQVAAIRAVPTCRVYPNPVSNQLNVETDLDEAKTVMITDLTGRKILEAEETNASFPINTATFENGYYLVTVSGNTSGRTATTKFVK